MASKSNSHQALEQSLAVNAAQAPQRSHVDRSLQATSRQLQQHMTSDQVDRALRARPSPKTMEKHGLVTHNAPAIASAARQLETNIKKAGVSHGLGHRSTKASLASRGILLDTDTTQAPALSATAHQLQRAMTKDAVHAHLGRRPSLDQMERRGLLNQSVAPGISKASHALERHLQRKNLQAKLTGRETNDDLRHRGIQLVDSTKTAPSLVAASRSLEKKLVKSHLNTELGKRHTIQELQHRGVLQTDPTAPALQAVRQQLQRKINQDHVSVLLQTRPTPEEANRFGVLGPSSVSHQAPRLSAPARALQRHQVADALNMHMRRRSSVDDLVQKGILTAADLADRGAEAESVAHPGAEVSLVRARMAMALQSAARLHSLSLISEAQRGTLKEMILTSDDRIVAALEAFEYDADADEMLDTMLRIARIGGV